MFEKLFFPSATDSIENDGCDPFNQNFWAELQKFLGVEWIMLGPNSLLQLGSCDQNSPKNMICYGL